MRVGGFLDIEYVCRFDIGVADFTKESCGRLPVNNAIDLCDKHRCTAILASTYGRCTGEIRYTNEKFCGMHAGLNGGSKEEKEPKTYPGPTNPQPKGSCTFDIGLIDYPEHCNNYSWDGKTDLCDKHRCTAIITNTDLRCNKEIIYIKERACVAHFNSKKEGIKNDQGKYRLDLLPTESLIEISKVLSFGAEKYGDYNWTNGIKFSRIYAATLRHLFSWWRGDESDQDSKISHLNHAACNLLFLIYYENYARYKEFDDRRTDPDNIDNKV